ncbi:nucleoredoxin-like protein 2 isoform X2 [Dermacentor albipictus]|uniref:nucleoredoxin-like protein 2 isoform X2 n=1 Tax=Dermacentor albipictus TaxID=60249 RepID=UPI0031FE29DF
MELFRGKTLLRKDGSLLAADDVLSEVRVLALYFSAGWCPACRMFTPVLADAYRHTKNHKVEVVFVSSDSSIFAMLRHMRQSHANWELLVKYDVTGIPALVVVKKDGSVVNPDARVDVTTKGHQAFLDWLAFS